jgi:hypothetical protein
MQVDAHPVVFQREQAAGGNEPRHDESDPRRSRQPDGGDEERTADSSRKTVLYPDFSHVTERPSARAE